jgi:hypothetical protein
VKVRKMRSKKNQQIAGEQLYSGRFLLAADSSGYAVLPSQTVQPVYLVIRRYTRPAKAV